MIYHLWPLTVNLFLIEQTDVAHRFHGKSKREQFHIKDKLEQIANLPKVNMKKVNYWSNIIGLVKLMTSTKISDPQLDCLKETPIWQLFDVLRIGKVDLNKCMKFNDVIAWVLETDKASKDTFTSARKIWIRISHHLQFCKY